MQSLQPLLALLEQTERERDDARLHLLRVREAQRAASAQADQLVDYRRDYEARWGAQAGRAGQIELVHCYQGFVARLSHAVDQQARIAAHAADALAGAERTLREREMRVASVRKLIERRVAELKRAADRREQKQLDEFAARAAWRHGADAAPLRAA
jgi:flagellar FliJ protein